MLGSPVISPLPRFGCRSSQRPRRRMKKKLYSIVLAGVSAALAFRYCPIPWAALFLLTVGLLAIFARLAKRTGTSAVMVNLAAVLVALASFEGYIGIEQP